MNTKSMNSLNVLIPIVIIALLCISIIYANKVSSAVKDSINVCLNCIVPSMYGFMIISELLIRTDCHRAIGKILSPVSRHIFHLDGQLFSILLISLVAGYPVGAKMVSNLERTHSIDTLTARNMYCYCYSGGLAFILGTIGGKCENGLKIALIVYVSNVIANLILAMLINHKRSIPKRDSSKINIKVSGTILTDSVNSAFKVLVTVCTMIIAFSVFVSLLDSLSVISGISNILVKIFKISNATLDSITRGILEISNIGNLSVIGKYFVPILASAFSFGGVCVILQIVSISERSFSLKRFLISRIFTCGVSFFISYGLSQMILKDTITVGYLYDAKVTENTSIVPSICLICMSFILISKSTGHFNEKVL